VGLFRWWVEWIRSAADVRRWFGQCPERTNDQNSHQKSDKFDVSLHFAAMFDSSLPDSAALAQSRASHERWFAQNVQAIESEIGLLATDLKERESAFNQQNSDLQDTYRRYITLTSNQCEKQLATLLTRVEEQVLAAAVSEVKERISEANKAAITLSRSLTEVERLATSADAQIARFSRILADVEARNSTKLSNIKAAKRRRFHDGFVQVLSDRLNEARLASIEEVSAVTEQMKLENNAQEARVTEMTEVRQGMEFRIRRLQESAKTIEECLLVAAGQKPLPLFETEAFEIASIAPASRRTGSQGNHGNLVVLAPIYNFSRRLQMTKEGTKFFTSRLRMAQPK
jgi:hypothetical protein